MSKRILGIAILALGTFAYGQDATQTPDTPAAPKKPAVKKSTTTGTTAAKPTTTKSTAAKPATAKTATPATGAKKTITVHHATTARKRTAVTHANPNAPTPVQGEGTTTPTGLKYWDIKAGTGATAVAGQQVEVQYTGWLTDGKKFDSSVGTGRAFGFALGQGQVNKGWDEGVAGMKVGGKRQLRIPPQLAYGDRGFPGAIPAGSTLIFDVELVGVK